MSELKCCLIINKPVINLNVVIHPVLGHLSSSLFLRCDWMLFMGLERRRNESPLL